MENLREQKGKVIALTRQIKKYEDGFAVQSQTSKRFYFVDNDGACTCPDCQTRQLKCKHAFAVQYFLQKVTTKKDGAIEIKTKRLTYPQAWSAYNKSQTVEKEYFLRLLKDLTTTEQAQNFGRPQANIGEMLFCCALKVYSQFSTRRANTDIKEAFEKGLISKPHHYNTIIKYFDKPEITPLLEELISVSASPLKAIETTFAVDSSGFRTTRFNEYCNQKHNEGKHHKWLKAHVCTGTKTNVISAVKITEENGADSPQFAPLVNQTAMNGFMVQEVSADMAYSSRSNYETVSEIGGQAFIPFKSNATGKTRGSLIWKRMFHYFNYNKEEFLQFYHKRSNVETTFSMIKAKFNDIIKNRKPTAQVNELLCKILCHNIVVVIQEIHELGIAPQFCLQSVTAAHKEAI